MKISFISSLHFYGTKPRKKSFSQQYTQRWLLSRDLNRDCVICYQHHVAAVHDVTDWLVWTQFFWKNTGSFKVGSSTLQKRITHFSFENKFLVSNDGQITTDWHQQRWLKHASRQYKNANHHQCTSSTTYAGCRETHLCKRSRAAADRCPSISAAAALTTVTDVTPLLPDAEYVLKAKTFLPSDCIHYQRVPATYVCL